MPAMIGQHSALSWQAKLDDPTAQPYLSPAPGQQGLTPESGSLKNAKHLNKQQFFQDKS
jgi:hypothetical protein